mgnify:CR=1 FL=1
MDTLQCAVLLAKLDRFDWEVERRIALGARYAERIKASGARAGRAVVMTLLVYNLAVAAVLAHAGVFLELEGIGLWPAAGAHGVLSVWCIASLRQV